MSAKHTPGPWEVMGPEGCPVKVFAGHMNICDIRGWGYLTGIGGLKLSDTEAVTIQDANARLIAAAPKMYDILRALMEGHPGNDGPYVDACALLAELEGA